MDKYKKDIRTTHKKFLRHLEELNMAKLSGWEPERISRLMELEAKRQSVSEKISNLERQVQDLYLIRSDLQDRLLELMENQTSKTVKKHGKKRKKVGKP